MFFFCFAKKSRDLAAEFGMGMNMRPPLMSREEFEARKAEVRRKREMEMRRVERWKNKFKIFLQCFYWFNSWFCLKSLLLEPAKFYSLVSLFTFALLVMIPTTLFWSHPQTHSLILSLHLIHIFLPYTCFFCLIHQLKHNKTTISFVANSKGQIEYNFSNCINILNKVI